MLDYVEERINLSLEEIAINLSLEEIATGTGSDTGVSDSTTAPPSPRSTTSMGDDAEVCACVRHLFVKKHS